MTSSLPLLVALSSPASSLQIEGDSDRGFAVVHPWGRDRFDRHGQAHSERNAAHAALPANGAVLAEYPLRLVFEKDGQRRELTWVLKIRAPEAPLPTAARHLLRGDVRFDTAAQNAAVTWSDGFVPGSSRSACGVFSLLADGRWEYTFDPASTALEQVQPGLMLQESFDLRSRQGTRCKVTLTISPLEGVPGQWALVPRTQLL